MKTRATTPVTAPATVLVTALAAAALLLFVGFAAAASLAAPKGKVILTVSGDIAVTNTGDGKAAFDLALLDSLPQTTFRTSTIWTDGVAEYSGVALNILLETVSASGRSLEMTALNDYVIVVPASQAVAGGPILATRSNGKVLSVRDKGPVWLIYPYDDNANYKTEVTYSHSIWQLMSIKVGD